MLVVGMVVVLAIPLVVAGVVLRQPRWYPLVDLAQTELHVRDVGTADPPLVGAVGRFTGRGEQGAHPGPLAFWSLWPVYRLLGATAWAFQIAALSLHLAAIGVIAWIANRRGGIRFALAITATLAVLMRGYGPDTLTEPWNPYLPLLWWVVLLLAVWSVLCDDVPMLPLAVFAASFCAQSHVSYVGLAAPLLAMAVAVAAARARSSPAARTRLVRWTLVGAVVGVVVWLPPIIEQLTSSPGNLAVVWDHFSHPDEAPLGLRDGLKWMLVHLDPWRLVTGDTVTQASAAGSPVPGLLLMAVWAAAAAAAVRLRGRALVRLHLVVGVALALGALSTSRIFGVVWGWLILWAWAVAALMLVAIGWTVAALGSRHASGATRQRVSAVVVAASVLTLVVSTAALSIDAAHVEADIEAHEASDALGRVVGPTVTALNEGGVAGGGRAGRYVVVWDDAANLGMQGWGLINELDRAGFDVGATEQYGVQVGPHRAIERAAASAVVLFAVGRAVPRWLTNSNVTPVAYVDDRSGEEKVEYEHLRAQCQRELVYTGFDDLVPLVDSNLAALSIADQTPQPARGRVLRMLEIGLPTAVFVGPPGAFV